MLKTFIKKVVEGHNLAREEAGMAMDIIMQGNATPSQIAAFLVALHTKGETIEEISGFADKMRAHAINIYPHNKNLVDTCGTGGDRSGTINISTFAAFVAAGAGVAIAKHGNRSVSSKCGSADVLEAMGVKVDLDPKQVENCINEIGIGFIFAPIFHKAMRFSAPTRKEIGISTVFNILGPLTNPAHANAQLLGVFHEELTNIIAQVLKNLKVKRALVVHGSDGLDEITTTNTTKITELKNKKIRTYFIKPKDLGIKKAKLSQIMGGTKEENAKIGIEILKGEEKGAKRDIVLINAAAVIYVSGLAKDLKQGFEMAKKSLDNGAALKKLQELINFSNQ